jgi:hypothetical protein
VALAALGVLATLATGCQTKCAANPGHYHFTFTPLTGSCADSAFGLGAISDYDLPDTAMCGTLTLTSSFANGCEGTAVLTISVADDGLTGGQVVFHETCTGGTTCDATFTATATLVGPVTADAGTHD